MTKLKLSDIRLDGETQARISLDSKLVIEYAQSMREGDIFPPVVVFHDGSSYWLADGFHRWHAAKQAEISEIDADIMPGTVDEAQVFAFGANADRGLSLTPEDRRQAVIRMLNNPITKSWTNGEIARHVRCSKMMVGRVKMSIGFVETDEPKTYTRKDGREVQIDTSKAPKKQPKQEPKQEPVEQPAEKYEPPPPIDEREQRINELVDTVNELNAENQRLRDVIAAGQWDATDIEKIDVQETLVELRAQIKVLEMDNAALRDSRDMFQNRNAELMKTVKSLQAKLKKS